jgi:hypothetical protein
MTTTSFDPTSHSFFRRINFRILIFAVVFMIIVGFPVYTYLNFVLSGGIHRYGNYTEADLKAMSDFPFDQVNGTINDIPQKWRDLDGKQVVVVGQIWAPEMASPELTHFELCYSIAKCCFSGPPQIQHFVLAHTLHGYVEYSEGLVRVTGILHVQVKHDGGKVIQVYAMDVESAKPI